MEIYLARDGQRVGPFPLEEVLRQLAAGTLQPTDLAWTEGAADWMPVSSLPGIVVAAPPPLASAQPPPMPAFAPRVAGIRQPGAGAPAETSGLAITSLVLGILSVTVLPLLPAIPAVICGHVARGKIKESAGALGGSGMALAGLIMGYLGLAFIPVIAILAGIALPVFAEVQTRGLETRSLSNAKQIGLGCKLYAQDNRGAFPQTLEELVPDYLPTRDVFICPLSGPSVPIGYEYYGGKETDPAEQVLLASKALSKGKRRVIVHVDLSGEIAKNPSALPAR
jgi:Domain of unknown function (DUF4190)/GYF domain 2